MATVTAALPNYIGSITIDADLLDGCGMRVNDQVAIANCRNGARLETYIVRGEPGSKKIELNGAAIESNKAAFAWGRRAAVDPEGVRKAATPPEAKAAARHAGAARRPAGAWHSTGRPGTAPGSGARSSTTARCWAAPRAARPAST
jgi:hypothetical protein